MVDETMEQIAVDWAVPQQREMQRAEVIEIAETQGGGGLERRADRAPDVRGPYRPAPLGTCSRTGAVPRSDPLLSSCASFSRGRYTLAAVYNCHTPCFPIRRQWA